MQGTSELQATLHGTRAALDGGSHGRPGTNPQAEGSRTQHKGARFYIYTRVCTHRRVCTDSPWPRRVSTSRTPRLSRVYAHSDSSVAREQGHPVTVHTPAGW